jgi:hypothetical protein
MHMECTAFRGDDPGRVLSPMLEHQQTVVKHLIDWGLRDYTEDSTHGSKCYS